MKTIALELSPEGVDRAIKELQAYADGIVAKTELLVSRLRDIGIQVVNANGNPPGDSTPGEVYGILYATSNGVNRLNIVYEGKDVLFIEFGAGIHFNGNVGGSPHPKGAELGYTIGSYGFGQGAKDHWTYDDGSGNRHVSYGTLAGMPMYKASVEMRQQLAGIAREVFGG